MWQAIVVGVLVSCSAAYAVWALMPARARLRLARGLGRAAGTRPATAWLRRAADRVGARERQKLAGCGSCGAAATVRREESQR